MSYNRILDDAINAGRALFSTTMKQFRDNQDFFNGKIGTLAAVNILNGSFEVASSNPDIPENWARTLYPGGAGTIDSATSRHGANSYKFTHPGGGGNGGGDLESDFFETGPDSSVWVNWIHRATIAGVRIKVNVEYFTDALVSISTQTIYNQTSNPTSPSVWSALLTVPATARFLKVTLIGGDTDTDPGASTDIFFDNIVVGSKPLYYVDGTDKLARADTERSTNATSYTKFKEIVAKKKGKLTVHWEYKSNAGAQAFSRTYINGVAVGAEHSTTSTSYVTIDNTDIEVFPGDLVQAYIKTISGVDGVFIQNFRLLVDQDSIEIENATLD